MRIDNRSQGTSGAGPGAQSIATVLPRIVQIQGDQTKRANYFVLIVDPDTASREIMKMVLKRHRGCQVSTLSSCDVAITYFNEASTPVDLLITYEGHDKEGRALIDAVRKLRPDQKILLVTGNSFATAGRANEILHQPLNVKEFTSNVNKLLGIES